MPSAAEVNPAALRDTAERLVEAQDRGLWKPKSSGAGVLFAELQGNA